MDKEEALCDKHNQPLEMFCFEKGCQGEKVPMCAMCMCEHVKIHHVNGATHITSVVKDRLLDVDKAMAMADKQQEVIRVHHEKAEEYLKTKDAVKAQLEQKLERLVVLYGSQKEQASDRNTTIMQCHEKILKAMKLCEHKIKEKINDPKRIEKKVLGMVKDRKYWQAYIEVNRALAEESKLDDKDIKDELSRWDVLIQEFRKQLKELDVTPAHLEDYKRMHEHNDELTKDNARLTSIVVYLKLFLEELDDCRINREAERKAKEELTKQLATTLGIYILI
jgi:hypothetical protein